jgi:molybdenum cofactor guanylyltransferase
MEALTAFVLAGGKSTRMGSDKAFLELGGRTLLRRALDLTRAATDEVLIVGSRPKFAEFAPVVEDIFPARGPLGAIHAALSSTSADLNLILAVDLPFVMTRFLRWLAECAGNCDAVVTVPRIGGYYEPLCALYRKSFVPIAEAALRQGNNDVHSLFSGLSIRSIDDGELARNGFDSAMFRNINLPEDWEQAKAEFSQIAEHL